MKTSVLKQIAKWAYRDIGSPYTLVVVSEKGFSACDTKRAVTVSEGGASVVSEASNPDMVKIRGVDAELLSGAPSGRLNGWTLDDDFFNMKTEKVGTVSLPVKSGGVRNWEYYYKDALHGDRPTIRLKTEYLTELAALCKALGAESITFRVGEPREAVGFVAEDGDLVVKGVIMPMRD